MQSGRWTRAYSYRNRWNCAQRSKCCLAQFAFPGDKWNDQSNSTDDGWIVGIRGMLPGVVLIMTIAADAMALDNPPSMVEVDGGQLWDAFHSCEIGYAFGTLDALDRPFTKTDRPVSDRMMAYWMNFIKNWQSKWPRLQFRSKGRTECISSAAVNSTS